MLTSGGPKAEACSAALSAALACLDADHQMAFGVHSGVGVPAGGFDFGWVFACTCEVDPGFLDAFGGVGDVAAPGHVVPEERERRFAGGPVAEGCVDLREAEGPRDGGDRARVLALVEQCYALPEAAFRVGEPVEASPGRSSGLRRCGGSPLLASSLASRSWTFSSASIFCASMSSMTSSVLVVRFAWAVWASCGRGLRRRRSFSNVSSSLLLASDSS